MSNLPTEAALLIYKHTQAMRNDLESIGTVIDADFKDLALQLFVDTLYTPAFPRLTWRSHLNSWQTNLFETLHIQKTEDGLEVQFSIVKGRGTSPIYIQLSDYDEIVDELEKCITDSEHRQGGNLSSWINVTFKESAVEVATDDGKVETQNVYEWTMKHGGRNRPQKLLTSEGRNFIDTLRKAKLMIDEYVSENGLAN
jgi:hypothetical protein